MTRHLVRLAAEPRFTGSAGNARARHYCADILRELGYTVELRRFTCSALAGLYGAQITGVWSAISLTLAARLGTRGQAPEAVGVLLLAASLLAIMPWILGDTVLGRMTARRDGFNLVARTGQAVPRIWLVAHIDSKWQPVSILARATGVVVVAGASLGMFMMLLFRSAGASMPDASLWVVAASGVAGSIPLVLSAIRDGSDGAVDNASGVATVLLAAELLKREDRVGVLLTDAEELGLVGATAFAKGRSGSVMLNCDTIDDIGSFVVLTVKRSSRPVIDAFRTAALQVDGAGSLRVMRLIPGILTDSVAFASAGCDSVTLSRGTVGTLARIHTRRDTLAELDGGGIEVAAKLLAQAAATILR